MKAMNDETIVMIMIILMLIGWMDAIRRYMK